MADPVVHLTNGVPDSGTGNVTTLGQTLLDGANATLGVTTGAAVTTDAAGTLQQYLRGLVKALAGLTNTAGALNVFPTGVLPPGAATASQSAPATLPTDSAPTLVAVTPTVTSASAYTAGNEVGGKMTFASAGRTPGTSGIVQDVTLLMKSVQTVEFDLYLFNADPSVTTWADKTAPAINAADVLKLIGVVKMTKNYSGLGTHTTYKPDETTFAPIPFTGSALYGILVTPGTPTFASTSDVTVALGII